MKRFFAAILFAVCLWAQSSQVAVLVSLSGASSTSNTLIVQAVADASGGTNAASLTTTITATTAGNFLVAVTYAVAATPLTPSFSDSASSTWTTDCDVAVTLNGRWTVASTPNIASGITTVTVTKGATPTYYSMFVVEMSGMKTSSVKDLCSSAALSNSPGSATDAMSTATLTGTQTDVGIACFTNRTTSTATYTYKAGWTALKDAPVTGDGDQMNCGYVLNGIRGPWTGSAITSNSSHTNWGFMILYKSAVAGSAPTGVSPAVYIDFETSTNTTVITQAIMNNAMRGGGCDLAISTATMTGYTIATAAQQTMVSNVTSNGLTTTPGGTRGLGVDVAQSHQSVSCTFTTVSATQTSVGFYYTTPAADTNQRGIAILYSADSTDVLGLNFNDVGVAGELRLEDGAGQSSAITLSGSTKYYITMQYNAGASHKLRVYTDDACGTQVGSEVTVAANGTHAPGKFVFGYPGAEGAGTGNMYFDNIMIDYINATFPLH